MEGEDLKSVFKIGQPQGSPAVGGSKSVSEPPVDMHEGVARKIKEVRDDCFLYFFYVDRLSHRDPGPRLASFIIPSP